MAPYPYLAPELQTLSDDALLLWGDAAERRRALEAILQAAHAGGTGLEAAVLRVDLAVAEGMAALRLPRGPVRAVQLAAEPSMWSGLKAHDGTLCLSLDVMRENVRSLGRPDTVFRTWAHESLHARRPFAAGYRAEQARFRGYEEGLAEGLARLVTREKARMNPLTTGYDYYVQSYRVLAATTGVGVEMLWRELWQHPPGEVRLAFVSVMEALLHARAGRVLDSAQRARMRGTADALFASARAGNRPGEHTLSVLWRAAFR